MVMIGCFNDKIVLGLFQDVENVFIVEFGYDRKVGGFEFDGFGFQFCNCKFGIGSGFDQMRDCYVFVGKREQFGDRCWIGWMFEIMCCGENGVQEISFVFWSSGILIWIFSVLCFFFEKVVVFIIWFQYWQFFLIVMC